MRPIYRWSGEYFGFVSNTGDLFDADCQYRGWVDEDCRVWDAAGAYLGELIRGGYIIREILGTIPAHRHRRPAVSSPPPPPRGEPRPPRPHRSTHFDALDVFPAVEFTPTGPPTTGDDLR
jgi:hypothetical protein